MNDPASGSQFAERTLRVSPASIALAVFAAIALFFLVTEHRAHLYGALPYLLVLACPLMHLFHHHGRRGEHGHHQGSTSRREGESQRDSKGEQP